MALTDFTWTIKDFDMCPQPPGQAIESPCFSIDVEGTTKFSLRLYPRGQDKEVKSETYVSLFLKRHCDDGKEELKVNACMRIIDTSNNYENNFEIDETFLKNEYHGRHDFIERKHLIGEQRLFKFSENVLTVYCNVLYKGYEGFEKRIFKHEDYTDLSSNLGTLLQSGNYSDITIRVNDAEFKAHTFILENRYPALMRQLTKLDDSNTYSISCVEASVFRVILQYLYTGDYCDDSNLEKIFLGLTTKEILDLRSTLHHPTHISASTEINVVNVKHVLTFPRSYHLKVNKARSYYLYSKEGPEWSWIKVSVVKLEKENDFEYVLKFKRMCTNVSYLFMQCEIQNFDSIENNVVKETCHLFENEGEWTTPIDFLKIHSVFVMLNVRLSAYDPSFIQSGCLSDNSFIRERQDFIFDFDVDPRIFYIYQRNLHRNMKNADVTLRVDKQEIPAHKAILSCRSEVFSKMFEHDTKENQTGVVDIDDVDESTMSSLVMYMYCGDIDAPLCVLSAIKLYAASDKYQVLLLKEKCSRYLQDAITVDTVADILSLAGVHQDDSLKQSCYMFITSNSDEIRNNENCLEALKSRIHLYPDILDALLPRSSKS